jgi:hypothetical protein
VLGEIRSTRERESRQAGRVLGPVGLTRARQVVPPPLLGKGWNWISFPLIPRGETGGFDPADALGTDVTDLNLFRYHPVYKMFEVYRDDFTEVRVGTGYELWVRVGKGLIHCLHHIGTTGSTHYESTAILKELAESYTEAGRWRNQPPDVVVRSHRHRHIEVRIPTSLGYGIAFCTAGWQLNTPFAYRIPGARITTPQIGGSLIRQGDSDLYTRHRIWSVDRSKEVVL